MGKRHEKIGIKQVIRLEWMDYVLNMLLAGMGPESIRVELKSYLADKKQSGGTGERGEKTYLMAIGPLSAWFDPEPELVDFRDHALMMASKLQQKQWLLLHWAILSAAYPFWFSVAKQTGRLLNLQEKVTQRQIFDRLIEQYGDRETVSRNARYSIRSFVAWGVLKDTESKGSYEKSDTLLIQDKDLVILLLEASLYATPEGKGALGLLINSPAFFPFEFTMLTGDLIVKKAPGIDVVRHGLDDELLKLKQ
ncbi:hypothetical protein [Methanosarcina sp. WWM596]|uniref:hypothetical protein n=1 Tax=Methanosarcina sp. WWM596 TaxID=1434103 RepID=UPI000615CAAC|nr:hypothetical protein [Methanosarcina sp. WWM596]AKB19632.1 VrlQ [Methanosarcina sp. WWM596]